MAFRAPENKLVVSVKQKYTRGITNVVRAANLNPENQINPLDWVNNVGEVVSVPRSITTHRRDYAGFSAHGIEVGDTVVFSYLVVGDLLTFENKPPVHRNEVFFRGRSYFLCDITQLFAVIRSGDLRMQNGYVMVEEPVESKLIVPQELKRWRPAAASKVLYIGEPQIGKTPIDVAAGDTVYYNGLLLAHYQIGEKRFGILPQDKILGRDPR